jgi:hypothetical protein
MSDWPSFSFSWRLHFLTLSAWRIRSLGMTHIWRTMKGSEFSSVQSKFDFKQWQLVQNDWCDANSNYRNFDLKQSSTK